MKSIIRLKRSFSRIGIVGLVFASAMLALSVVAAFIAPGAERRPVNILLVGSIWTFFMGLSAWLILAYRRGSVVLGDGDVTITGAWIDRTIRLSNVTGAQWRRPPKSLRLILRTGERSVRFGNYRLDRRRELVRFFRDRIDPGVQSGWDEAWGRYAGPEAVEGTMQAYGASFRKILRLLVLGPILGLGCGLILGYVGPGVPTWTGSLPLDWTARGTLVGLGLAVFLRVLQWIDQPEQSPSPDEPRDEGDDCNIVPQTGWTALRSP